MKRIRYIVNQTMKNMVMGTRPLVALRARWARSAPRPAVVDVEFLERYAYSPFRLVMEHLYGSIEGCDVAEIGPGDHIPVALLLLASGARSYTGIDRFKAHITSFHAKRVYSALYHDLPRSYPALVDSSDRRGIVAELFPEGHDHLAQYYRRPAEEMTKVGRQFDIIFSYSSINCLLSIDDFAEQAYRCTRAGGTGIHFIDFRPQDFCCDNDDPSDWLGYSDLVWSLMTSYRGGPNRRRLHEFVESFERAGFEVKICATERWSEEVFRDRTKLAPRFRTMPTDSLCTSLATLRCKKPSGGE
jgi:hypothetical protein